MLLHGWVLMLQSDHNGSRGYGKDYISDNVGNLLLKGHAFQVEKRQGNILKSNGDAVP